MPASSSSAISARCAAALPRSRIPAVSITQRRSRKRVGASTSIECAPATSRASASAPPATSVRPRSSAARRSAKTSTVRPARFGDLHNSARARRGGHCGHDRDADPSLLRPRALGRARRQRSRHRRRRRRRRARPGADGVRYLDFAGGIGCQNLGHNPEAVVERDPRAGRPVPAPVLHGRRLRALRRRLPQARRALALPRRRPEVDPASTPAPRPSRTRSRSPAPRPAARRSSASTAASTAAR